jgi:hypothetical protein
MDANSEGLGCMVAQLHRYIGGSGPELALPDGRSGLRTRPAILPELWGSWVGPAVSSLHAWANGGETTKTRIGPGGSGNSREATDFTERTKYRSMEKEPRHGRAGWNPLLRHRAQTGPWPEPSIGGRRSLPRGAKADHRAVMGSKRCQTNKDPVTSRFTPRLGTNVRRWARVRVCSLQVVVFEGTSAGELVLYSVIECYRVLTKSSIRDHKGGWLNGSNQLHRYMTE